MEFLALAIAKLFSPIGLAICFFLITPSRDKWWSVPLAALVSAIVSESLLASVQITRDFGDGIGRSLIGGIIQASVVYLAIIAMAKAKGRSITENDKTD